MHYRMLRCKAIRIMHAQLLLQPLRLNRQHRKHQLQDRGTLQQLTYLRLMLFSSPPCPLYPRYQAADLMHQIVCYTQPAEHDLLAAACANLTHRPAGTAQHRHC
jgi:hypothetical protein